MWTEVTIQEFSNLCKNKQTNGDCELDLEYSLLINIIKSWILKSSILECILNFLNKLKNFNFII